MTIRKREGKGPMKRASSALAAGAASRNAAMDAETFIFLRGVSRLGRKKIIF